MDSFEREGLGEILGFEEPSGEKMLEAKIDSLISQVSELSAQVRELTEQLKSRQNQNRGGDRGDQRSFRPREDRYYRGFDDRNRSSGPPRRDQMQRGEYRGGGEHRGEYRGNNEHRGGGDNRGGENRDERVRVYRPERRWEGQGQSDRPSFKRRDHGFGESDRGFKSRENNFDRQEKTREE